MSFKHIATTAPAPPLPMPTQAIADWGWQAFLLILALREGSKLVTRIWEWIAHKGQAESQLLLQKEQDESALMAKLIDNLINSGNQQHEDIQQIKSAILDQTKAITNLSVAINRAIALSQKREP